MLRRTTVARDPALRYPAGRPPRATLLPMLFAALAGASSVLAFAPVGWWPLQILALAFLFYQVGMDTSVRRSSLIGWAFGFGWSVAGMHWLYITMNRFGNIPGPMAVAAVCLLGAYMGLFGAFASGVSTWLRRRWSLPVASFLLLVLPFMWGLSDWMRGWILTGFPWVATGYAHNASPLGGYAAIVGVYGIGVIAAVCASCIVMLTQRARWPGLGLLGAILGIGYGLSFVAWTTPQGMPISVRLLQGNVAQQKKFDPDHVLRALEMYRGMITAQPADLIALPETAIASLPQYLPPDYLPSIQTYAAASGSHVLSGIPMSDGPGSYANSVIGFSPSGQAYRYDKHHLVPFGEFVPAGFRWFVDMMRIPLGDMSRGAEVQPAFAVKDQLVLPNVCYEDVFGEEIAMQLRTMPRPATMLLNVSNLAWFGESVAIPQHVQMSQMRSLETGRPMLRATNTGATVVIDGRGKIVNALPMYTHGSLAARVQGMGGMTPFIRMGNYLFLALAALAFGVAWFSGRNFAKTQQT
ncbi:apolipoprotein N-acyltransferase [Massilia violaceinigra]|uniref:Apolipoprotein N-acyltransferase n=1 Tax=Massilia violaceinigra TaxID=2045208 RepID=A0ABY4A9B6_9BURK|nr:apolipoprotein N-acyltransferase [Massilia violaceinigra]UOD31306.1 apolipoprotein N-acyltransferase [Massilia violaceinigra]